MGTSVDKTSNTVPLRFAGVRDEAISAVFHSDPIARKACTKKVDAALRQGMHVSVAEESGGVEMATAIVDALDDLKAVQVFREALTWENAWGGSVIVMGIDDGQSAVDSQALPVRVETVRRVVWLKAVDRRRAYPSIEDVDTDPLSPTYSQPTHWMIDTLQDGKQVRVHSSRVIVFPGMLTTPEERAKRSGWGISVFDVIWEVLQRNITAWQSAGNSVANAQYVVYKLKGLAQMLGADGGEAKLKRRTRAMELAKSMINAVLIDHDDEYIRENPNFGNMGDMIELFMLEVASALDMPVTELWGRAPAGLNATGESDRESWLANVQDYREHHIRMRAMQLISLVLASKEGPTKGKVPDKWSMAWKPLRQLSQVQEADVRLKVAQADAIYVDAGVVLPDEVAMSRFRPEGYSMDTQVDHETRKAILKAEIDRIMKNGREPKEPKPGDGGDDAEEEDAE
jgi:phage-related protein (TIGR01555 family)